MPSHHKKEGKCFLLPFIFRNFAGEKASAMAQNERNPEYMTCPIRQVIAKFGDKWSMLVLYQLGRHGTQRFNEIHRDMSDCSQKMLSQTLKRLEAISLVRREVFPEVPPRVEYSLTDTGQSLMPALAPLIAWAKQHFDDVVKDVY